MNEQRRLLHGRGILVNPRERKVQEILKAVSADLRLPLARDILKRLHRKWVEARKEKAWAAELLAAAT